MTAVSDDEVFSSFASDWIDQDNIEFYRGLLEQRLLVNRCQACGSWYQPPWPTCPSCWSVDVVPTEVSGLGVVYTFTIPPTAGAAGTGVAIAVVQLAEQDDLRAAGPVVGCASADVEIGMPVQLTWMVRDGHPVPAFEPPS